MTVNTVTLTDTDLVIEPQGLDKLFAFTSRLTIPLAHVRGATHDPDLKDEPKGWRGPGLRVPGKLAGTFHADGEHQFWNVSGYEKTVVVALDPQEHFTRLVVTVDDPRDVVDRINAAIAP